MPESDPVSARFPPSEDWTSLAGWEMPDASLPRLVSVQASQVHENLLGLRARFRLTSYVGDGLLVETGWRDNLRVQSVRAEVREGWDEPAIMLVEESAWYHPSGGVGPVDAYWVGQSRVTLDLWRPPEPAQPDGTRLLPALKVPGLVGRRVVVRLDSGAYEDDLRVVSDPRMTTNGDFVVSVLAEHDWYRWPAVEYGATHRSLRALRICRIWVEV